MQPLQHMPRDSLASRMMARGTLRSFTSGNSQEASAKPSDERPAGIVQVIGSTPAAPVGGNASGIGDVRSLAPILTAASSSDKVKAVAPKAFGTSATVTPCMSKEPARRLSLGERLRAGFGAALVACLPNLSKPSKRKVGKQRPSCLQPGKRKSLSAYRPRRRKVGKQRPSFIAPLVDILKAPRPCLPENKHLVQMLVTPSKVNSPQSTGLVKTVGESQKLVSSRPENSSVKPLQQSEKRSSQKSEKASNAQQEKRSSQKSEKASNAQQEKRSSQKSEQVSQEKKPTGSSQKAELHEKKQSRASQKSEREAGSLGDKRKRASEESCADAPGGKQRRTSKESLPMVKRVPLQAAKREEDNYELSDLEEDKDGNRIEPDRSAKRVPVWSLNFKDVLQAQANLDPDSIFGSRMPQCDLEAIFPDSFYRGRVNPVKRRRGSSCHWFKDALTRREIAAYALKMGQKRRWSHLGRASRGAIKRTSDPLSSEKKLPKLPKELVSVLTKPTGSKSEK